MAILKKSDILKGIDEPRKVRIKSLGGELYLRPLSSLEVTEVTTIEAEGYGAFEASNRNRKTEASGKMNLAKMNEATAKAQYQAIYLSINNPKNDAWEMEEIKQLKKDAITEIYEQVMEISGASTTEADVKKFPEDK